MTLNEIIAALDLQPHPEGGHYRETFRDRKEVDGRSAGTAIYYALGIGDCSAWHKVDATEIWHWYAGSPLALTLSANGNDAKAHRLGNRFEQGERPQIIVPAGCWQTAESLGEWTLVGCTVAPGFSFDGFEMAPPDWRPTPRPSSG